MSATLANAPDNIFKRSFVSSGTKAKTFNHHQKKLTPELKEKPEGELLDNTF
jgi:hypothetical protein